MIAIIDYGMGNIHSVKKALESMGADTLVTNDPEQLVKAEKIVFPGVGAFGDAKLELEKTGMGRAIKECIRNNKVFLGICLGMQILFESSQESEGVEGLGILKGYVKKFANTGLKVPHMGWNQLKKVASGQSSVVSECPLLKNIPDNSYVYFCHSYYPAPFDGNVVAAATDYGLSFASVVWQGNVFGVQFHPEKSQKTGLSILNNFVAL